MWLRMTVVVFVSCVFIGFGSAEEAVKVSGEREKKTSAWLRYCNERSDQYKIFASSNRRKPFKKKPEALMLHTQPIRGDQVGAIYLWTDDAGRSAAVGTVILHPEKSKGQGTYFLVEEFHSLYDEPIRGDLLAMNWNCRRPGLDWVELKDADPPREGKLPLKGMARRLVRSFTAEAIDHNHNNTIRPLRFQPSPVHEFYSEDEDDETIARFLFAGCLATDPEVFLSLEARKTSSGNRWFYSFAQFSDMRITAQYKKEMVWRSRFDAHIGAKTLEGVSLAKD